ncbi:MAG: DUF2723 domain-containing protein [Muribaculaceae bacterium]|nr:DUF2723 domain-containing protein [Muribaculaceae bacterium]
MLNSPLSRFRLPLAVSSWVVFAISLTLYWITADPGVSYWDCPEYVTVASKMEVGHPPGNPIWMLTMRVATIPFSPQHHAYVINLCSGLFMAFATFFLCRIICLFTCLYFQTIRLHGYKDTIIQRYKTTIPIFISVGAALCFAFCDSAWFSAVEAEVYAMSTFLTALSLWIMILWWWEKSKARQIRLLVLLVYLTGLSLGVHQLNLLLIPIFALIILYKKYPQRVNPIRVWVWFLASCLLLGIILTGFMPGMLFGAESFELFAVNSLSLPFNSGIIIFFIILISLLLVFSLIIHSFYSSSHTPYPSFLIYFSLSLSLLAVSFSSFAFILIRAKASPPMNEGTPDNIFALASYINRDQYPSTPLIYGNTPYSRPMFEESFVNGFPQYNRYLLKKEKPLYQPFIKGAELNYRSGLLSHDDSLNNQKILQKQTGYLLADYKFSQVLTPELDMWFPRMTSRDISDRKAYQDWGGMTEEKMNHVSIAETFDSNGNPVPRLDIRGERHPVYSYKPTYYQNLKYFVSYQAYYMYFRYLFWNFIGRQNDFPSNGEIEHGNFISGIPPIDNLLVGPTEKYPYEIWEGNKGHNEYFGIPFIAGILGIVWLACGNRRSRRALTLISVFFLMTGIAIVVYLNQDPGEPRERDYTFLGSYMAFSLWIAAGLTCLARLLLLLKTKKLALLICAIITMGPATLMALENFDDHDRRNRFEPSFYASSLLDFEIPSIIFSQGDNSSFPLWYASEVLELGKNHTPIDITYLSMPSYVINLKKQGSKGIITMASTPQIAYGKFLLTKIPADSVSKPTPLGSALKSLYTSNASIPEWPSSLISIEKEGDLPYILNLHDFTKGSSYLPFKSLMLLDLLNSQSSAKLQEHKTLFFPHLISHSFYAPIDSLLLPALFGKIYAPRITYQEAMQNLQKSIVRELKKLDSLNIKPHYADPVITDRSVRYRGELIIAANQLLNYGDTLLPIKIVEAIESFYSYDSLLPGSFTLSDSTYYEGREFIKLLNALYEATGEEGLTNSARYVDSLMQNRHNQWMSFYQFLSPEQRATLSPRSRRLLQPHQKQ